MSLRKDITLLEIISAKLVNQGIVIILMNFRFLFNRGAVDADGRIEPGDLLLAVSLAQILIQKYRKPPYFPSLTSVFV